MFHEFIAPRVGVPMRHFLDHCIDELPQEFFTAPASSSGKHHPPENRGDAGLMCHTMSVVTACEHLFRLYELVDQFETQAILGAALLHDGWKGWSNDQWLGPTQRGHGETAARKVRALYELWSPEYDPQGRLRLQVMTMCSYIEKHMVQWAYTPYHFEAQPLGVRLLATADFVTSRVDLTPEFALP